jgi:Domain of Unknown Function with PDB structure (DUF3857)/Transglutaminase-like superfamily
MLRLRLLFVTCLAAASVATAQKPVQDWLPITQEEKQIQDVPWHPGSAAIQLYFDYYKDDNENFISVYKRIKILKESGTKYADIEIPLPPGTTLKQLAAHTIHPDGTIIEFKAKPFEKTIFKTRGVKYTAAVFTMPDVSPGSIVECRYVLGLRPHVVDQISVWPVQHELFTLRENLRFRAFQGLVEVPTEWGSVASTHHSQVSYSYVNQIDERIPEKKKDNLAQLELTNVPPFDAEEFMPPEDDYKPAVFFFYGGRETASPEKFWDEWGKIGSEYKERFIGDYREVKERAAQVIGNETDPEKKLRKLYAAAQQIRNLSYERTRNEQERKKEDLKRNRSTADVLAHGYGSSSDINHLFVAMARASGFEADILQVSDRARRSFNKIVLSLAQLDADVAGVRLNGKDWLLDPGTVYCPFGLVRWQHTAVQAMRFSRKGAAFVTTPDPQPSQTRRVAKVSVSSDGSLQGELSVEFDGQEALEHRLDALDTDEPGRRKRFEEEVESWLPNGGVAKMQESAGWNSFDQPLTARFTVTVPSFASVAGKRLVLPSLLLSTLKKNIFNQDMRRYPISFSYPFSDSDEVLIKLPAEYSMEVLPYHRKAGLSYADYEVSSSLDGNQLKTERQLRFDGVNFPPEAYAVLKGFFNIVQAGDGGQAVLHAAQDASKQPLH